MTGPEGVFGFPTIDEVDSLDRRLRGKAVDGSDDSDRKETRPGARKLFEKWAEGRWAKRQWTGFERTGEPLEREEELSEEVRTIVNEASKNGRSGESQISRMRASACEACTQSICAAFKLDEQEKLANKIYTKRLQAMIKVKRYVDSCRHTLERKNETCTLVRRDCDKVNAALARAKEYCNDRLAGYERKLERLRLRLVHEKSLMSKTRVEALNDVSAKGIEKTSAKMMHVNDHSVCRGCPCCDSLDQAVNTCPVKSKAEIEEELQEKA